MTIHTTNILDYAPIPRYSISQLPINLFASVMGVTGLSLAWREATTATNPVAGVGEMLGGLGTVMFLALAAGYVVKWHRFPSVVSSEFRHPVQSNFFAAIAIGMLLQSSFLGRYSPVVGQAVWIAGSVLTFVLAYIVLSSFVGQQQSQKTTLPPLLIPGVATLDIAVTGATMPFSWAHQLNLFAFAVGSVIAALFVALIMGRLRHEDPMPITARPSLMVIVAPFAVGFLAYTNITGGVDLFATVLFYFAVFLTLVLAPMVFRTDVPFSVVWWAISFPLAALSIAFFRYADAAGSGALQIMAVAFFVAVAIAIAVVFLRTAAIIVTGKLFEVRDGQS